MSTPVSHAVLASLHDRFASEAVADFNRAGELRPQLFAVQLSESGQVVQAAAMPSAAVESLMNSAETKALLGQFLQEVLTPGTPLREHFSRATGFAPDVLVLLSEVWVTAGAALDAAKNGAPTPPRSEALVVALHTAWGSYPILHPVSSDPRRASLASFPAESDMLMAEGRLTVSVAASGTDTLH